MRKMGDFKDFLRDELRKPGMAEAYLELVIENYEEDGDTDIFLNALQNVAEAQGRRFEKVAPTKKTLSRVLFNHDKIRLDTIGTILHGLGYQSSTQPIKQTKPNTRVTH